MNNFLRAIRLAVFAISIVGVGLAPVADAQDLRPRIVVVDVLGADPPAAEVIDILIEHLAEVDIWVGRLDRDALPQTAAEWTKAAKKAGLAPGTVALVGYDCTSEKCAVHFVDCQNASRVIIPVKKQQNKDVSTAFALAATIREALLGPLVPELARLVRQGEKPAPPPPSPDSVWIRPPLEDARKTLDHPLRPWLWLEGGYQGEHAHPDGQPVHGPWVGVTLEPRKAIAVTVSGGWLGIREQSSSAGSVRLNCLTAELAVRILLPLGPAHLSFAPTGRLDVAFSEIDPNLTNVKTTNETDLDIQAGLLTTWHLPLTQRLDVLVGAGVLATLLSRDYDLADEDGLDVRVIPSSTIRVIWLAGIAWSPI